MRPGETLAEAMERSAEGAAEAAALSAHSEALSQGLSSADAEVRHPQGCTTGVRDILQDGTGGISPVIREVHAQRDMWCTRGVREVHAEQLHASALRYDTTADCFVGSWPAIS
jgi:hypothetical protein